MSNTNASEPDPPTCSPQQASPPAPSNSNAPLIVSLNCNAQYILFTSVHRQITCQTSHEQLNTLLKSSVAQLASASDCYSALGNQEVESSSLSGGVFFACGEHALFGAWVVCKRGFWCCGDDEVCRGGVVSFCFTFALGGACGKDAMGEIEMVCSADCAMIDDANGLA
ncbi:hypothetical protein CC86DRAFT_97399 [Ophiobolus disseminans]|uniref:Uncharacterized protein n=1 Tax=Ophiobolus disseminans TaxID=1469910 RepID=A0A6A6ZM83_9PLEO|nr:hypothetical protein CC86DRAFT_97399 [Ophiobolus disseminans]